jgi:hypothetical protein
MEKKRSRKPKPRLSQTKRSQTINSINKKATRPSVKNTKYVWISLLLSDTPLLTQFLSYCRKAVPDYLVKAFLEESGKSLFIKFTNFFSGV